MGCLRNKLSKFLMFYKWRYKDFGIVLNATKF